MSKKLLHWLQLWFKIPEERKSWRWGRIFNYDLTREGSTEYGTYEMNILRYGRGSQEKKTLQRKRKIRTALKTWGGLWLKLFWNQQRLLLTCILWVWFIEEVTVEIAKKRCDWKCLNYFEKFFSSVLIKKRFLCARYIRTLYGYCFYRYTSMTLIWCQIQLIDILNGISWIQL